MSSSSNSIVNHLFVEKYRPKIVDDCILPKRVKATAASFVTNGSIPHLILSGPAGTGKTTLAKALCKQLGYEVLFINGSLDANMATLREDIVNFASAMSLDEKRKCVLIDEGDYLSTQVMAAMRSLMETLSGNCSFIITCNFPNRILDAIVSRCALIDFTLNKAEHEECFKLAYKRVCEILTLESIEFDKQVVAKHLMKYYPDLRKTLNELQRFASVGPIDSGIFASMAGDIDELVDILKDKNFAKMRKWVASTPNLDMAFLCRQIYNRMGDITEPENMPQVLIHLADGQYKDAFAADKEINMAAMLTQIMMDA